MPLQLLVHPVIITTTITMIIIQLLVSNHNFNETSSSDSKSQPKITLGGSESYYKGNNWIIQSTWTECKLVIHSFSVTAKTPDALQHQREKGFLSDHLSFKRVCVCKFKFLDLYANFSTLSYRSCFVEDTHFPWVYNYTIISKLTKVPNTTL